MAVQPTRIGLAGLAVMGQNLALNIASKGFQISVYNRTTSKVDETVERAKKEGNLPVYGFHDPESFVNSIQKPRVIIMLVKAGAPVDQTIKTLSAYLEKGDCIVDGGNEWYENTERREKAVAENGFLYLGMGVSGGEEGARNGPSMMPGGSFEAYKNIEDILLKVAAQVRDSGPCVTYIGKGGSGNFVKMVHNGIEYGDMQLIAEAYDVLKSVGKLTNEELHGVFTEWNKGELESFLVEITADIFGIKDDKGDGHLVDKVLDKTGMKGTGKWTVQQAAELSVPSPTIESSLDARFLSGLKDERVQAAKVFKEGGFGDVLTDQTVDKKQLIDDVRKALYASKICSYAQGMNLIRAKSVEKGWGLKLGELARIWKGGCIIRAIFLDRIKQAYDRNAELANLLVDPELAKAKKSGAVASLISAKSVPKSLNCLAMRLVGERINNPEKYKDAPFDSAVEDPSLYHYAIFSDNVIAVSVVVRSVVMNAEEPWKHVFHVVTDRMNLAAMKVWFKMRPLDRGAHIEIKSVDEFKFLNSSYAPVLKQLESAKLQKFYFENQAENATKDAHSLKFKNPKYLSMLNHLRFYLPEMYPKLNKILFLDDDVVVQKDVTGLWKINLDGKVNGAVETCFGSFHRYGQYLNFTHPLIKESFNPNACAWAFGMNIFDLNAWRREKCTDQYHYWQNLNEDRTLWELGTLPPGLMTFYSKTKSLDKSWHVLGLGYNPGVSMDEIKKAAVIHYNGNMKPWLDIAMNQYKSLWTKYVDNEMEFVQMCNFGL